MKNSDQHGGRSRRRSPRYIVAIAVAIVATLIAGIVTASTASYAATTSPGSTASDSATTNGADTTTTGLGSDDDPTDDRPAPRISRAEVVNRANYWFVNQDQLQLSYGTNTARDPDDPNHLYREDCSGYVSMALHLLTDQGVAESRSTLNLPDVGTKIDRTQMQPGDYVGIMGAGTGGANGHVRLFEKWENKSAGTYWAYDFGADPVKHQIYQFSTDDQDPRLQGPQKEWTAYRYDGIY